jgi:hypothetical protein
VESYVFCMSVDSADTGAVSAARRWGLQQKTEGLEWGGHTTGDGTTQTEGEGGDACRQSYSSSALEIGSVSLPQCNNDARS